MIKNKKHSNWERIKKDFNIGKSDYGENDYVHMKEGKFYYCHALNTIVFVYYVRDPVCTEERITYSGSIISWKSIDVSKVIGAIHNPPPAKSSCRIIGHSQCNIVALTTVSEVDISYLTFCNFVHKMLDHYKHVIDGDKDLQKWFNGLYESRKSSRRKNAIKSAIYKMYNWR